jgi:glycosyltransferase involved in cell wall biosynthesis
VQKSVAPSNKLHVIYNGVADVPPAQRARPDAGPPRIVAVARFEPPKDHATLLQALARLAGEAWELELVGDGPLLGTIRDFAARLGIAGRVRFSGYERDPAAALSSAQLFALSSRSEGFPRSILEAMRAGLPVVASNVGGVGEAVIQGENGVVVEAGDVDGWAAALRRMIGDAPARERFGAAARSAYEAKFRLERTVAQTRDLYAAVLAARRHGA